MVGRRFFSLVVLFLEIRARLFGSITTSRCPRSAICTSRLKRLNHVAISGRGLCKMSLEPLRRGVEVDRNSDKFLSTSAPCLPRQPLRLALLRPCLPAAMRYKTTTPTKTHLGRCHILHHPSHPTLASGLVYHRYGSIDGPFYSYLSLLVPSSQYLALTTISAQHDVRLSPHVQTSNRWVPPWHLCLITCPKG